MILVFDTYNRRTKMYYFSIVSMITAMLLFSYDEYVSKFTLSDTGETVLGGVFFAAAIQFFIYFGFFKRYVKDGEIAFSQDRISSGSFNISLTEIKRLVIKANHFHGATKGSDGSGNFIDIHDQYDHVTTYKFVLKDQIERDDLRKRIAQYAETGIPVSDSRLI